MKGLLGRSMKKGKEVNLDAMIERRIESAVNKAVDEGSSLKAG
mgnify:CR=1 FL=1